MSKRVLTVLLAIMMAVGIYTAVASAGVEGDFTFDFALTPQTTTSQVSSFTLNFEGILDLDVTLSGLTLSNYMTFGIAGLETYVLGLSTTLGALDLTDQFWFSVPYDGSATDVRLDDNLYFVKKRVDASITLGGLTFDMLVLFEDLNFSYPYTHTPVGDQDFAFGACFTLSGATVSGIGVESVTGINCDPQDLNVIKKYYAYGAVQTDTLNFTVEKINITGIEIGPLTIDDYLEFRPLTPVANTIEVTTTLMGLDIDIALYTEDITQIGTFTSLTVSAALGDYFTFIWYDDGNLTMDAADTVRILSSIPIQQATFSNDIKVHPTVGIYYAEFGISLPVPVGTFSGSVVYGGTPLAWQYFDFELDSTIGGLDLTLSSEFGVSGLDNAHLTITIPFSA